MALRIFLTSDLHLGMKFAGYPEPAQTALVEARFACLERMVDRANAERADLFVVAGDLFERVGVAKRDIERAARALRGFQGRLVAVLPGNHDYLGPEDELWPRFRDAGAGSILVLEKPEPVPLTRYDLDACLYPGPCTSKHSDTNAIGWVAAATKDRGVAHHVGVAHGAVEGMSLDAEGRYYPMTERELSDTGVPLWLIGHTHARFPVAPGQEDGIFCAGTPEPDGFDCAHEGYSFLLDVDTAVTARAVRTGRYRFAERRVTIAARADLDSLESELGGPDAGLLALRLYLRGRVPRDLRAELGPFQQRLSSRLLHLDLRADELREEITQATIDAEYPVGSFPHSLLTRLGVDGDQEALEIAQDLLGEARS